MINGLIAFVTYLGTAFVLLAAFIFVYVRVTPYKEFHLISQGNSAAAITLSGATLGFTLPLVSSIYYTQSLLEMIVWAAITCLVQLLLFILIRHYAKHIEEGVIAPAILVATLSISIGLLNAVSISH